MKIGIIGAGAVGQMHMQYWSSLPNCQLIALTDLRPQLLQLVADKYSIPRRYNSHYELLTNQEIEAVAVITRRHNTAAVVFDCLNAGKHVFSEKPMAMTLNQAKKLVDVAEKNKCIYAIGYQRKHDAGTQIAKRVFDQLLSTGELGKIVLARVWNFTGQDRATNSKSVMTTEERPTGWVWEQAPEWMPTEFAHDYDRFINVYSHDASMLRYFFGSIPKVSYINLERTQGYVGVFEFSNFSCGFEGGLNELNSWEERGEWDEGLEIFFEKGRLTIRYSPPLVHHLCSQVELTRFGAKHVLCDGKEQTPAFQLQASSFVDDVLQGREPLNSGKDTIGDLVFIESIWQKYLSIKGLPSLVKIG